MEPESDSQQDSTRTHRSHEVAATIPGYHIVRKIGAGGMGIVFEAEQHEPRRPVALKVVRDSGLLDPERAKLLRHEAQTLARLKHPNIAAVYDSGTTPDGRPFFVMELVRGEPLSDWLSKAPLGKDLKNGSLRRRLALFHEICDTVSYAHMRGIIHRDLKPSNILVSKEHFTHSPFVSEPQRSVKILDFGLARMISGDDETEYSATAAGSIQGTVAYMSPEQARGNPDEVDARTDVYSLGLILYEMVTDELPYQVRSSDLLRAVHIICEELPAPPSHRWKGHGRFPRDLEAIILKTLEKQASHRYQSASALADDVRRYLLDQPVQAKASSTMYQLRKLIRRHRLGFGMGAAILVFVLTLAITTTWQSRRIAFEARRAEEQASRRQQVADFLVGLFRDTSPYATSGENLTLREVLDAGSERVNEDLQAQPLLQAELMFTIGNAYLGLGMFEEASPNLWNALKLRQRSLEPDDEGIGEVVASLAELERLRGHHALSDSLIRESVRILESALGPEALMVGEALHEMAVLRRWQERYTEAESLYARAIRIHRLNLGDNDERLAKVISDLGVLYWAMGRFEEAEERTREALKIREKVLPANSLWIGESFNNLGALLARRGAFGEAEEALLRGVEIREQVLGPEHHLTATTRSILGTVYLQMGRYDEAEFQQEKALEIHRAVFGEKHHITGRTMFRLAQVYEASGRPREALDLVRQGIAAIESSYGGENTSMIEPLLLQARIQIDQGDSSGAESSLRKAMTIQEGTFGTDSEGVAQILDVYVELFEKSGRQAAADSCQTRAARIRNTSIP